VNRRQPWVAFGLRERQTQVFAGKLNHAAREELLHRLNLLASASNRSKGALAEICNQPKSFTEYLRMTLTRDSSAGCGCRKSTTSSAYNEILCPLCLLAPPIKGCKRFCSDAFSTREFRTSITRMNNIGERGSPTVSPAGEGLNHLAPHSPTL
jgi:hypothetical protein